MVFLGRPGFTNDFVFRLVIFTLIICFLYKTKYKGPETGWDLLHANTKTIIAAGQNNGKLLINTTGCQMEQIDPFDERYPEIKKYFKVNSPQICNGKPLSTFQDGILRIDPIMHNTHFKEVTRCYYKPFSVEVDSFNTITYQKAIEIDMKNDNRVDHEWILVECSAGGGDVLYRNFHSQIIPVEQFNEQVIEHNGPEDLNVIVVLLESVSRLTWLRHCQDVHEFITSILGGVLINGHHVVGGNTIPNAYAVLRGTRVYDDLKKIAFGGIEAVNFIFKDFAKNGYALYMQEDFIPAKVPSYVSMFKKKPIPHHDRPFRLLRMDSEYIPKSLNEEYQGVEICYGEKNILNETLNQIVEFNTKYLQLAKKHFSFTGMNAGLHTHGDHNGISSDKAIIMDFFRKIESTGIANNTVIFFGGDHGCRLRYFRTHAGNHEARLPVMYAIFPKWFREKYTTAFENFKFNANERMTSQYDLYYTLKAILNKDFINPQSQYDPESHYGMNLLARVPESRTCDQAGVSSHFCVCGTKTKLKNTDPRAIQAGKIFISGVNKLLNSVKCVRFEKFDVTEAYITYPKEDILLTIDTKPVRATFRTTLSLTGREVTLHDVERLEHYANVTSCLKEDKAKLQDGVVGKILVCVCKEDAWKVTVT